MNPPTILPLNAGFIFLGAIISETYQCHAAIQANFGGSTK
tara:strand:- start:170 stop:289 length:120 start_codon:yes stop_codon:yes gene_type:complete